jgi:hypothetical protein
MGDPTNTTNSAQVTGQKPTTKVFILQVGRTRFYNIYVDAESKEQAEQAWKADEGGEEDTAEGHLSTVPAIRQNTSGNLMSSSRVYTSPIVQSKTPRYQCGQSSRCSSPQGISQMAVLIIRSHSSNLQRDEYRQPCEIAIHHASGLPGKPYRLIQYAFFPAIPDRCRDRRLNPTSPTSYLVGKRFIQLGRMR